MKFPCDMIRDLLPLYKDNICSDASKDIIEDHLSVCEDCREYYERMSEPLPEISSDSKNSLQILSEQDFFKKISRKLTFRQIMIGGAAALVFLTVYALLTSSAPIIKSARDKAAEVFPVLDRRIPIEDVNVQNIYKLEDGSICCFFTVDSYISSFDRQYVVVDEDSPRVDNQVSGGNTNGVSMQRYWSDFYRGDSYSSSFYFIVPEELTYYRENPVTAEEQLIDTTSDGVYFIGKGGEILPFYEKGDRIADAPSDIESKIQEDLLSNQTDDTIGEWSNPVDYSRNYCHVLSWNEENQQK